uniref:Sec-independent protein translocase component TatC n=1 Tax=Hypnea flava TaxID=1524266 RepID=UPI0030025A11|nr:Sec-independent protein translocase component TatC [Hypnea flava]
MCCILCSYIIIRHLSSVIFIESFFFIKLGFNQVILINITDLFDLMWYTCLNNTLFCSSVYFCYSLVYFFKPSWYSYQEFYRLYLFKNLLNIGIFSLWVFYFYLLPLVLDFLTNWDINYFGDLVYIKFKLSLFHYITWVLCIKFYFIAITQLLSWFFIQVSFLIELKNVYFILKKYKKSVFYVILCVLYLISPPDICLQFFILILNIVLVEILYFYICFITQNIY